MVAAHSGCVDWNCQVVKVHTFIQVAAHSGCVDWNTSGKMLLEKTPGRSPLGLRGLKLHAATPISARVCGRSPLGLRGLKYFSFFTSKSQYTVAAHSDCVDWNLCTEEGEKCVCCRSPFGLRGLKSWPCRCQCSKPHGRSPFGLRGFKSFLAFDNKKVALSQPTRAAWIEIYSSASFFAQNRVAALLGCVN